MGFAEELAATQPEPPGKPGFADELAAQLLEQPTADEPDYSPRVEFDGSRGILETGTIRGTVPQDMSPIFQECLRAAGYDPERVRVADKPIKESHWQQRARKRVWNDRHNAYVQTHEFETVWLHAYKFETFLDDLGPAPELAAIVKSARVERRPGNGPHWFVFQAGDMQIGKRSRDGSTEQILRRYVQSVEAAAEEFAGLKRHGIEGIQVSMPGDCLEGNQSQGGRNLWLTQQTITEQVLLFQRLLMFTVEAFAPLTERLFVDVVNGNHDEAQRQQNTYPGDGWATTAATFVSDALKMSPLAFGHVDVRVPEKWSGNMTVPVGDTIVTVVHGHQWRRDKAMDWWAKQAIGNHAPGAAQVLQHGHWHEWAVRSNADRTVVASPTFDCGSDWFRNNSGGTSKRGAAVYLLRSGEVSCMSLV